MEFVALGIWFIFHPGFLSYLQHFPRFWLQLDWEAGGRGEGDLGGLGEEGEGGRATGLESVTHNSAQLGRWKERQRNGER
ncbi:hypothetical protein CgunFtcFv8_017982 [Champsocephalus gunnari]|uniref:Uncharacterized protein n=1 Tax=Champsocephalus gunnari TaxID=52237 RepID=A0AAN8HRA8_CHAGU|nr:hypothetical protein CgunFtcFv8_017982 [Champsocephalus gunnari]